MIDLENIKGRKALIRLGLYDGRNPYLIKLKAEYKKKGKITLSNTQEAYILNNFDKDPVKVDRVVTLSEYIGEELKEKYSMSFVPVRMYFGFILAQTDKSYHVYGKLKQNQKDNAMYWIPKTQVMEDPFFAPVDIDMDFTRYLELDTKSRTPFQHQEEGIKFLLSRDGCILADDMGLGKTYQAIVAALETGAENVLIVCPASTKINWKREIEMFGETDIAIINSYQWESAKWTIINYDILKNFHTITPKTKKEREAVEFWDRDIMEENFDIMIVDEAHKVKDPKSNRGAIVGELSKNPATKCTWLLTGTPVANRPKDFFNLLKIIKSPLADNYPFFMKRYCDAKTLYKKLPSGGTRKILIANGESNLDELSIKSRNYVMRRLKEDVLDMPDKIVTPTHHELTEAQVREYDFLWEEYLEERKAKKKKGTPDKDLVEIILLRKFIAKSAIEKTIEMAETAIEDNQKVVIFTTFNEEQNELAEYFGSKCVRHNGSMNDAEKQKSVDKFQKNKGTKVFIGNIISAGVGITLTEGTVVIFNSFDWVPGNNEQAEDRCYRIGQENTVNVYYQLFEDTITTRMWYTVLRKRGIIDQIIGTNTSGMSEDVIDYLTEED